MLFLLISLFFKMNRIESFVNSLSLHIEKTENQFTLRLKKRIFFFWCLLHSNWHFAWLHCLYCTAWNCFISQEVFWWESGPVLCLARSVYSNANSSSNCGSHCVPVRLCHCGQQHPQVTLWNLFDWFICIVFVQSVLNSMWPLPKLLTVT